MTAKRQYKALSDVLQDGRFQGMTIREALDSNAMSYMVDRIRDGAMYMTSDLLRTCKAYVKANKLQKKIDGWKSLEKQSAAISNFDRIADRLVDKVADKGTNECIHGRCWMASNGCKHAFRKKCDAMF